MLTENASWFFLASKKNRVQWTNLNLRTASSVFVHYKFPVNAPDGIY